MKMWCKTQATVALSSAEAELYGLVRASAETLGIIASFSDLGEKVEGQVLGDASAALAIIRRQGIGRIRHLDTHYLWVQEKAARGELEYKKVDGKMNGADVFTKPLNWEEIKVNMGRIHHEFEETKDEVVELKTLETGQKEVRQAVLAARVKLGLTGALKVWQRTDLGTRTSKTSMKG